MNREICGGCRSTDLRPVLDLGTSPLAGRFPQHVNPVQPRYPLKLLRCFHCTLVQLSWIVDDKELWSSDYSFYTGASWPVVEQQRAYALQLVSRYELLARGLVVEIACNDGTMLKHLGGAGGRVLGVDPASGPAARAQEAGLNVIVDGFSRELAERIVSEHGQADLVVANNVIAHVADLDDFISGLDHLLSDKGVIVLEFQYVADLVTGNQIGHVYHEHRQYFSLTSLNNALDRHNLKAMSLQQTESQGGSLRVHVKRDKFPDHSVLGLLRHEAWLRDEHALAGMQGRAERIRSQLRSILVDLRTANRRVAGYGASAKAVTLLNFCDISTDLVQYFVDTTPFKQGRYTPGTNIPVISPESDSRAPDVYLLGVHNYLAQVLRRERTFTGQWLVPIPQPVLL